MCVMQEGLHEALNETFICTKGAFVCACLCACVSVVANGQWQFKSCHFDLQLERVIRQRVTCWLGHYVGICFIKKKKSVIV